MVLACAAAVTVSMAPALTTGSAQAMARGVGFWTATADALTVANGWTLRGLAPGTDGLLRLAPASRPLFCSPSDVDGGPASYDPTTGLCAGRDPYLAGAYNGRSYYNGGRFSYGTILSPVQDATAFDQAVVSWVATTPPGAWLQAHLRARLTTGVWTRWYNMPVWASGTEMVRRHSINGQGGLGTVSTDTLALYPGHAAMGYQIAVTLFTTTSAAPTLRRLSLATSQAVPRSAPRTTTAPPPSSPAWGTDLPAPARSQMLPRYRGSAYGGGGEVWCSPTSVSMILAYWARTLRRPDLDVSVPLVARGVYDWTYDGAGDWPFNVAYATSFPGMDGYVARFPSLDALEPWIAAGVPIALSIAYAHGALPGAPNPASDGHLLVLRGFDRSGNAIVNDPAARSDATVRRVYPRAALEHAWLFASRGTAYVIFPRGWRVPSSYKEISVDRLRREHQPIGGNRHDTLPPRHLA